MFVRTISLVVAATLSSATLSFPAQAATDEVPSIRVSYADLDLSTKEGKEELRSRVSKAAGNVCRQMRRDGAGDRCRTNLTQSTLASLDRPAGTAIAAR